jgi:hypothetical protein
MYGFWALAGGVGVGFAVAFGEGADVDGVAVGAAVGVGVGVGVDVGSAVGVAVTAEAGAAKTAPSPRPNTAIAAVSARVTRRDLFCSIDSSFRARAASAQRAVRGPVFSRANRERSVDAISLGA